MEPIKSTENGACGNGGQRRDSHNRKLSNRNNDNCKGVA